MLYKVRYYYYCPFCDRAHDSEHEAKRCRTTCAEDEKIWKTKVVVCLGCDEQFKTEKAFHDHIMGCAGETCATCEHHDLEGRRSGPCRQYNGSPIIAACEYFERATK